MVVYPNYTSAIDDGKQKEVAKAFTKKANEID